MKSIDVSEQVMQKIVRFEETRTRVWLRRFYIFLITLVIVLGVYLWISWKTMSDLHTWDLLNLFSEDWEIITEFWSETIMTFFIELPAETLIAALVVGAGIVGAFVITKKRRKIIALRRTQLANQKIKSKNKRV